MTPFTSVRSVAVPMPDANIDTDIILPARFLLQTDKVGLGAHAFYERRFDAAGRPIAAFPLNDPRFAGAAILVAGDNFGCGSSREQAVWALIDLGLACVIAPGFGEIFAANCARNGVLALTLPKLEVASLMADAEAGRVLAVDLDSQIVTDGRGRKLAFTIAPHSRAALLNGWDEPTMILAMQGDAITAFEAQSRADQPWLWSKTNG